MARGSPELSTKELEELLDAVDQTMDRLKTLYEQYFMGIQKQAPAFIHSDVERKLRDLTQMNIRNTGLRYRLATLQQKFGAYNSYWRRTLRQIENGTYVRNLAKIGREAARTGAEVPEEILAKMPKRMREQVLRDREAAIAIAKRRNQVDDEATGESLPPFPDDGDIAAINEPSVLRRELKTQAGAHILADDDADLDFESLFAAFNDDAPAAPKAPTAPPPSARPAPDPASTQAITRPIPKAPGAPATPPGMSLRTPAAPTTQPTTAIPRVPSPLAQTGPVPVAADPSSPTTALPKIPQTGQVPTTQQMPPIGQTSQLPRVPAPPGQTGAIPPIPGTQSIPRPAPSQASRPNPIQPGSSTRTGPVPVQSMNGPFPRPDTQPDFSAPPPAQRPVTQPVPKVGTPTPRAGTPPPTRPPARPGTPPPGPLRPPPGMTEADVNALHAKYVKAKEAVGEKVDASSREKLLRTINQTAPKIMEQYKASGVDFSVVVKDNQVVIKAKPKT